jgi:protein-S-isoprenylcysteine O-methyltransferase Ste14
MPAVAIATGAGGMLIWFFGAKALGARNLNMEPDSVSSSALVTRFPYNLIRHPMYTGLAMLTLGFLLSRPSWPLAVVWGSLLLVLNAKATVEESTLENEFPEYAAYRRGTTRFLPFLW